LASATRITCCVSVNVFLGFALACSTPSRSTFESGDKTIVLGARTLNGQTELDLQTGRLRRPLTLKRDDTVAPDASPLRVNVVADLPGRALILTDAYPSLSGGLSYCQAGEEQFLRVISIVNGGAAQTFVTKIASCRGNLELSDQALQWDPSTSTLQIHWLSGPSGAAEDQTVSVANNGAAVVRSR
jgi:hypothetical protein